MTFHSGCCAIIFFVFQRSFGGQCIANSIIQFQKDTDAECDVTVTTTTCSAGSILDINSYLLTSSMIVGGSGSVTPNVSFLDQILLSLFEIYFYNFFNISRLS